MGQYRFNKRFLGDRDRPGSVVTLYPHAYHPSDIMQSHNTISGIRTLLQRIEFLPGFYLSEIVHPEIPVVETWRPKPFGLTTVTMGPFGIAASPLPSI
jgi:hypothetical protein